MYTDVHQLIVFLCGVERLHFARERRRDERNGQWRVETLPRPGCRGLSQSKAEASFPGRRFRLAPLPRESVSAQPSESRDCR